MGDGWAYRYDHNWVRGFKQTHQPSPWINDYGQFVIMPVSDATYVDENSRASYYSHKSETARPYYYQVYLADHDINVELTPSERAAAFRFTYPESSNSGIVYGTEHVHPEVSSTGRLGHEYYNTIGYIPYDAGIHESVARTLEYAYNDWCILQLAKKLDRPQEELDKWEARSNNWKNVFDPSHNLMRGRNLDGTFQEPFSPYKWGGAFTEGNAWHYTWSVFHDVDGLAEAMGGKEAFAQMLDSVFVVPPVYDDSYYGYRIHEITEMQVANMGNYAHGNQPAQHMIYLYNWAGQPWKTQKWVREVMDRLYSATPDGYCGDEDNGQTSAWYVFSALGFYPVCPGSDEYAVGSPLFKKAVVHLENGQDLEINAPANSPNNRYVRRMKVNCTDWKTYFFKHKHLAAGGIIDFNMTENPKL